MNIKIPPVEIELNSDQTTADVTGWREFEKFAYRHDAAFRRCSTLGEMYNMSELSKLRLLVREYFSEKSVLFEKLMDAEMKRPIMIVTDHDRPSPLSSHDLADLVSGESTTLEHELLNYSGTSINRRAWDGAFARFRTAARTLITYTRTHYKDKGGIF